MWVSLVLLLLAPAQSAQPAFSPDVRAAERRLVEALQRHDRAAFEQLIEPDAIFFIPGVSQGRDAIIRAWIPFLATNGSTLALQPGSVSGEGAVLVTEGRFAITGNGPIRPVADAVYLAVWKHSETGWLLHSFAGGAAPPPNASTTAAAIRPTGGVGDYRFGMTRQQVRQVPVCSPYLDVPSTSGLECPNFTFEGRKMNVSFIFAGDALRRVQLWYYEGKSEKDAKAAATAAIEYLSREAGAVHSYELPGGAEVTADEIVEARQKTDAGSRAARGGPARHRIDGEAGTAPRPRPERRRHLHGAAVRQRALKWHASWISVTPCISHVALAFVQQAWRSALL